jgi:hypothetical protein
MTVTSPLARRNAAADLTVDAIDAGPAAGTIQIRTAPRPAVDAAATGTLLVTITLNDPAFGAAAAGVATMDNDPVPAGIAVASGTAAWFRLLDSTGTTVLDGSVTATGDGGDLVLATTAIVAAANVTLSTGTVTQPQ